MSNNIKVILGTAACMVVVVVTMIFLGAPKAANDVTDPGGEDMVRNRRISATYARELMERYPNAIILDVRTESEFAEGHIPGAILLPDFDIGEQAGSVLPDYDVLILVYCRSGVRSRGAMSLLLSMGYVNVYDFGGINSWPYEVVGD